MEHLGSESEPIILGGVAELNSLAENNPEKFTQIVINIFTSYCKSEASLKKNLENIKWNVIQSILDYLTCNECYNNRKIDLSGTNLSGTEFKNKCVLKDWSFMYCTMPVTGINITLDDCYFQGSKWIECHYSNLKISGGRFGRNLMIECLFTNSEISSKNIQINAADSNFFDFKINNDLSNSKFLNCNFTGFTTTSKVDKSIFFYCRFEHIKFKGDFEMVKNSFNGSGFSKTAFYSEVKNSSFKSITNNSLPFGTSLEQKIKNSFDSKKFKFSGITFKKESSISYDEVLNLDEILDIIEVYNNVLINSNHYENKKINPADFY